MSTATPETPRAPATPATPAAKSPAAKTRAKPKAAPRAAAKKAAPPAPAPAPAPADKDAKPRKPKLVRDSFTIPKDEYAAIDTLKQRATAQAHPAKKSELLRAGLKLLSGLDDAALLAALQAVPAIKTGRPKASRK
ncbi:hypothetical protein [Acidovorax sp. MR-S7]|uniref:hypothetical protein n=1 Tax=Acidovorax sp. MR-S7 TaxID=1268622 RepID=UPI00035F9CE7|nr:hypothetical protein [Acidovorax sp. MR-S7]GAD24843.1 hypothetical protein AVS7_04603 [Acidovorax sp. MR-S7]